MQTNPHDYMREADPTRQGFHNKLLALDWTYRWGYSTPSILQMVLKHEGMSWTTSAIRGGWLRKTGITSRERVKVVTLTEKGVSWVEQGRSEILRYSELDPHRISPMTIWHNLLAQRVTLHCLGAGEALNYRSERQEAARSQRGAKQPDVVWETAQRELIAVEIELNSKWDQRFDEFVSSTIDALSSGADGEPARFDKFIVMTTSPAIAKRYRAAFQPGVPYRIWRSADTSRSAVARLDHVPEWVSALIEFRIVNQNGEGCLRTEQSAAATSQELARIVAEYT